MKEYNCPDCQKDSCKDCHRLLARDSETIIEHMPPYFPDSIIWPKETKIPNCCDRCSNHPKNGGSGVCHCVAPLYDNTWPYRISCSVSTTGTSNNKYLMAYDSK